MIAIVTLTAKIMGLIEVSGYTATILTVLFLFSFVVMSQGILGSYLWRCFENTKGRPQHIIRKNERFDGKADGKADEGDMTDV
jgi:hypothetical protein